MSIPIRLAADIGGTFTDVVLESEAGFQSTKILTTLYQPEIGVMQGIDELLRLSNIEPGQITHVIHGTTLGTNTVIERKGAKTAFLRMLSMYNYIVSGFVQYFLTYKFWVSKQHPAGAFSHRKIAFLEFSRMYNSENQLFLSKEIVQLTL